MGTERGKDCLIIGGGVAGFQAALTCRRRWPDKSVAIVDGEREVGYYRSLMPQFMAGALGEEQLFFWREGQDPLLTVWSGAAVKLLDRANRVAVLDSGAAVSYERLILAQGGQADRPGLTREMKARGVFTVRDLTTARKTRHWLSEHRPKIIVLGASLVAVKTAVHLRQAGYPVALLARRNHVLLRVLTPGAAQEVESHLRRLGIELLLGCEPDDYQTRAGDLTALHINGAWHPCGTLLVAAGATPDTSFLTGTDLLAGGELRVSANLQTRDERIFAAGDVATIQLAGGVTVSPRTWPEAVAQGKLAAENLYRPALLSRQYFSRVNALELHGLPLVILGPPVPGAQVVSCRDIRDGVWREVFLVDGRIQGGALIGDISGAGVLQSMMAGARPVRDEGFLQPGRQAINSPGIRERAARSRI